MRGRFAVFGPLFAGSVALIGCQEGAPADEAAYEYAAPTYLKALANPSEDELLEAARKVVRQSYGMAALGKAEPGWTVHVFLPYGQDMKVFGAIQAAWEERGVTAIPVQPWEATGETQDEFEQRLEEGKGLLHGYEASKEAAHFEPKFYPYLSKDAQEELGHPVYGTGLLQYEPVGKYLSAHQEIEHFFMAPGGGNTFFCASQPDHCSKMAGNWSYINAIDITNHAVEYPADVWNLVEEVLVKPAPNVSEGHITDPQGTDLRWEFTPEQARNWASYVKKPETNNHLFVYPSAADTSVIEGVIAGTANHIGFMPLMKVTLSKHGKVVKIEGGGETGDHFRSLFENPALNYLPNGDPVCFPGLAECGYWFISSDGLGTNPKKVRNFLTLINGATDFPNLWERERAGVLHLSFGGVNITAVKEELVEKAKANNERVGITNGDPEMFEYAFDHDIPVGHTAHIHNYFPTIKWKLRDTGEWLTISDKGRPVAFDDPRVRALAASYGDPDVMFSYDWIPGLPGINMPGDRQAFEENPWAWVQEEWNEIQSGTYPYYKDNYQLITIKPKR